jgi:hypothetical protein
MALYIAATSNSGVDSREEEDWKERPEEQEEEEESMAVGEEGFSRLLSAEEGDENAGSDAVKIMRKAIQCCGGFQRCAANCQIVKHGEAEAARHHDGRAL